MKAQVSTEYLLVNAALLTLILIMAAVAYQSITSLSFSKEVRVAQDALEKIYAEGLSVYYQGSGAKRTFVVEIPSDAQLNHSTGDNVLFFVVGETQVAKKFDYPIDVKKYPKYGGRVQFEVKNNAGTVEVRAK